VGAIGVQGLPIDPFTPGTGYTGLSRAGTVSLLGNDMTINPEYQIVAAQGSYQADATLGILSQWSSAIATYQADTATHFNVSASANATVGTPINVTVTAMDAANNAVNGYT